MADTIRFPNVGEVYATQALKDTLDAGVVKVKLFTNDVTLNADTVHGDFTVATFTGYSGMHISFGAVNTDANDKAYIQGTQATFTNTATSSGNTIYGWFIDVDDVDLVFAKKYSQSSPDNRKDMNTLSNVLKVTPTIRLFDTSITP